MVKPSEKRLAHFRDLVAYDRALPGFGTSLAGMDEAGRGPLVGNVVAACVILPAQPLYEWIDDSKRLSPKRREEMYERIMETALFVGVGEAGPAEHLECHAPGHAPGGRACAGHPVRGGRSHGIGFALSGAVCHPGRRQQLPRSGCQHRGQGDAGPADAGLCPAIS